ncbi:hypothetical protein PU560_07075, partial [Georgenia sp. 10Sc9-8]|nr:hypothetical protein [Georgenia halotolerans]
MSEHRSLVSYLRRGARTALTGQGGADLDLVLGADDAEETVQVRGLQLAGPEHTRGIAPTAVRKHVPAAGSTDMRAGGLPYVEWHDPALPWALTPTAPQGGRLPPFLALLCVPEGDDDWLQAGTMPVPRALVHLPDGLPDPAAYELMAHVEDPDADAPAGAPGPRAFSRMLCPQRLAPRTRYVALVVPLYERGRLAGLGEPVPDGAGYAWQAGEDSATLPVYLSWRFTTGSGRGAEDMLRDLHAVPPTGRTAELPVAPDATAALLPALQGGRVTERAIFPVQPPTPPQPDPDHGPALDVSAARAAGRLPMPAYGRTFADGAEPGDASAPRWYTEANLDPSLRVMAGHGAAIVRRRQDEIVQFVLDSAGQLEEANAVVSRAHTAMTLTGRVHERLAGMPTSTWSRLLGPAAARTRQGPGSFVTWVAGSSDDVLQDPTLHRAMAAGGPLDRDRSPRGDPADAVRATTEDAATSPTVPGADPLGDALRTLDARTATTAGVVVPGKEPIEEALDRVLSDPRVLQKAPELAEAHDARRARQDADRRRPDRPRLPAEVPDRAALGTAVAEALDPAHTVPPRIADRIDGLPPGPLPRRIPAEPVWPKPVVSELFAVDPRALSPGLADLPDDAVMGLDLDAAAVDAVVLGANSEVLRELRWRGVPHDPLASPVRRAFDAPAAG